MKLRLSSYLMTERPTATSYSFVFDGQTHYPTEYAEVKSMADVFRELDAYAERAKAANKPLLVYAGKGGGRAVTGFNKASDKVLRRTVNVDLLPES